MLVAGPMWPSPGHQELGFLVSLNYSPLLAPPSSSMPGLQLTACGLSPGPLSHFKGNSYLSQKDGETQKPSQ